jgi:branched-chain amino acid transport system permease protein
MEIAIQYITNALSVGGTYALLALGLAIVFGILGFINFAHGEIMTICGYVLFYAMAIGLPFWVAIIIGVIMAGVAAVVMERIAFRPLRGANPMSLLIAGFALSGALQISFLVFLGERPKPVPMPEYFTGAIKIGGIYIGVVQVISIVVTIVAVYTLNLFLKRTKFGISLLAAAEDFSTARLMGIRANAIFSGTFAISGLLAGIAGVLWLAQRGSVSYTMGFTPLIKAFIATIIGGMGSLTGAVLGGFLLGALEIGFQIILPSEQLIFRDPIVLFFLIAVLLFRPGGLIQEQKESIR